MNTSPDMTMAAVKMIFSLAAVLLIVWGLYYWARRHLTAGRRDGEQYLIHVLASRYLGVKKSISLVKVPGQILVLAITSDRISLLSRIDNPDQIDHIQSSISAGKGSSFTDQLQHLLTPIRQKKNSIFGIKTSDDNNK